jgi:hypothetical protein
MNTLDNRVLNEISGIHEGPCASIYMATSHGKDGCDKNTIKFKNLKRDVIRSLLKGYDELMVAKLTKPLESLARDTSFWSHQSNGLAVFLSPTYFRSIQSNQTFTDTAIVADRFHTKPLVRAIQSADQFYVLTLSLHHARLFLGNRYELFRVDLGTKVPKFSDFAAYSDGDHHIGSLSAGAPRSPRSGRKAIAVFHNYDDMDARRKIDNTRYFTAIDAMLQKSIPSNNRKYPIILAALGEYQSIYHQISKLPGLVKKGITKNPDVMTANMLRSEAWQVMLPHYLELTDRVNSEFHDAVGVGMGSDRLSEIGRALSKGRVKTLLIEQERKIPGKFLEENGIILQADLDNPHVNDVLDDFADVVTRNSGDVLVLPLARMPTKTGAAAIYRY